MNKSIDGGDTLPPRSTAAKPANPGHKIRWSQPTPVDLDEIHHPSLVKRPCRSAHLNLLTMLPHVSSADGTDAQIVSVSPMPCHANSLSRLEYTPSHYAFKHFLVFLSNNRGKQSKSVESHRKRILGNHPINHKTRHINSHLTTPVSQPACKPRLSGTLGTFNSSKPSRHELYQVGGSTSERQATGHRLQLVSG